jgi:hypothetical protein
VGLLLFHGHHKQGLNFSQKPIHTKNKIESDRNKQNVAEKKLCPLPVEN